MITISGAGFNETVQHTCLFSCRAVAGVPCNLAPITSQANVIDDAKFLTCRSPEWPYPFETSHWEIDFSMTMTDGAYTYTMHYLGDYFRVFLTKASMNLTQGLDASGSLMGGSSITIKGRSFCWKTEKASNGGCASKFICQFTQVSGSGSKVVRSQECAGGIAAGTQCSDDDEALFASSAVSREDMVSCSADGRNSGELATGRRPALDTRGMSSLRKKTEPKKTDIDDKTRPETRLIT